MRINRTYIILFIFPLVFFAGCVNIHDLKENYLPQEEKIQTNTFTCGHMNTIRGISAKFMEPSFLLPGDESKIKYAFVNHGEFTSRIYWRLSVDTLYNSRGANTGSLFIKSADYIPYSHTVYPTIVYDGAWIDIFVDPEEYTDSVSYLLEYLYNYTTSANITLCLGNPDKTINNQNRLCSPSEQPKICQTGSPIIVKKVSYDVSQDSAYITIKFDAINSTIVGSYSLQASSLDLALNNAANLVKEPKRKLSMEIYVENLPDGAISEFKCGPGRKESDGLTDNWESVNAVITSDNSISDVSCVLKLDTHKINLNIGQYIILSIKIPSYWIYNIDSGSVIIKGLPK